MNWDKIIEGSLTGLFGGIFAGVGIWIMERLRELCKFKKDEKKIIKYIKTSMSETNNTFRTTYRIASEVNLTENRVAEICSNSKKIRRNQKQDESWTLRN